MPLAGELIVGFCVCMLRYLNEKYTVTERPG
jgi:hypothetical protein